ncbi:MAG: hypothetical protein QXP16_03940, partial [Candidatus Bathyarchaeia archaeon]
MNTQEETPLQLNPEEIRRTAETLANIILTNNLHVQETPAVETINLDLITSSTAGIFDPLGQLKEWFTSTLNSVAGWISASVQSWIGTYISPTIDAILGKAGDIWRFLQNIGAIINEAAAGAAAGLQLWIATNISPAINRILTGVGEIGRILQNIGAIVSGAIIGAIPSIATAVTAAISPIALEPVYAFINWIRERVEAFKRAAEGLGGALGGALTAITSISTVITGMFPDLSKIGEAISGIFKGLTRISDIGSGIASSLAGMAKSIEGIASALGRMPGTIGDIAKMLEKASKGLGDFLDWLLKLPDKAPAIYTSITTRVWQDLAVHLFKAIKTEVIYPLTGEIDKITEKVSAGMTELGKNVTGFINAILRFPEWFPYWFRKDLVGEYFKTFEEKHLLKITGKPVKGSYVYEWWGGQFTIEEHPTHMTSFMVPVAGLFQALTDPLGWLKATIIGALQEMAKSIWSGIQWMWKWLTETINNALKTIWEALKNLSLGLFTAGIGWSASLIDFLKKTPEEVEEKYPEILSTYLTDMQRQMLEKLAPFHSEQLASGIEAMKITVPEYLTKEKINKQLALGYGYMLTAISMPLWGQIPARIIAYGLRGLARSLRDLDWSLGALLRPLGIGVETRFNLAKTIGATLYTFSDQLVEWTRTIGSGLIYGYAIWLTQPMSRLISYHFRNLIPVQLPREDVIVEYVRRSLSYTYPTKPEVKPEEVEPSPEYKATLDISKFYMGLYGYSDEALRWLFSHQPEDWVDIKDRFDTTRYLPKSLVHELPSASDMARMMVRDMFKDPDQFAKAIQMRGMTRDTAYLYYMFHFRYPPPERLWNFTVRGISGLLWATLPNAEKAEVEKEAKQLGAYTPITPVDLNFKPDQLLSAFRLYMKWHDFARFSWVRNFASDNLIYVDTLADIPTKIDQRWLVKWGLYETLSAKDVKHTSPVSDFTAKILETTAKSEVKLDLTNFCRTMQATGLHPYWVPITAVAETMNVLSDERTLLRTGFLNLFKEGFWNVEALETLLKGFVTASFQVAYFDVETMTWKTGWINQPVMFLPPERKLLELRAVMDRALDILRDIGRDIARAYSEWIIADYKDYKEKMTQIIEKINTFFAEDYKAITGAELREELKLNFVEAYYKPYIEGLEVFREVFTIRRVRYWTARWLGYTVYRLATGVVKKEDALNLLA